MWDESYHPLDFRSCHRFILLRDIAWSYQTLKTVDIARAGRAKAIDTPNIPVPYRREPIHRSCDLHLDNAMHVMSLVAVKIVIELNHQSQNV